MTDERKNKRALIKNLDNLRFYLSPRYLLGITLIIASFISAYVLSSASSRTIEVWATTKDLAPGSIIEASDIQPIRVLLPENASRYLSLKAPIVGSTVIRSLGRSELIPSYALSTSPDGFDLRHVPVSISRNSMPIDLSEGQNVDVYSIPNKATMLASTQVGGEGARLLLSGVGIKGIDQSSKSLGGEIGVTLLVPAGDVASLISSFANSQIILVKKG